MIIPLFESHSTVVVGGTATLRFSPGTAGASWNVTRIVTSISGGGVGPQDILQLVLYRNAVSETNRLDGTSSAAQDTSETDINLNSSDTLIAVYSGIPNGASCSLTISGTANTGRF
jgi:hypothetical protein